MGFEASEDGASCFGGLLFFDHMETQGMAVSSVNSPILSVPGFILIQYLPARRLKLALGCL